MELAGTAILCLCLVAIATTTVAALYTVELTGLRKRYNDVLADWTKMATEQMDFVHSLCMVYSEPDKWQKNIRHTLIDGHDLVEVARLSWMGLTEDQKSSILKLTALKE